MNAFHAKPQAQACPCGGTSYLCCCAPWHQDALAPTPEALMRSRYSAYVLTLESYLQRTWHVLTRPTRIEFEAGLKWLGLTVIAAHSDGDVGSVEFVARFRLGGASAQRLYERSRFVREGGAWFYLDAV